MCTNTKIGRRQAKTVVLTGTVRPAIGGVNGCVWNYLTVHSKLGASGESQQTPASITLWAIFAFAQRLPAEPQVACRGGGNTPVIWF